MTEKQPIRKEINCDANLQFIDKVRQNTLEDPKNKGIVIIPRMEDMSIFTTIEEENVLLSFSS